MTDQDIRSAIEDLRADLRAQSASLQHSIETSQANVIAVFQTWKEGHELAHANSSRRLWAVMGILSAAVGGIATTMLSHYLGGAPAMLGTFGASTTAVFVGGMVTGQERLARFAGKLMGRLAATKWGRKLVFAYMMRNRK